MCSVPIAFMFVFYMNYLWLTPHYFVPGRHRYYFIINFVVIITLGIGLHFWMDYTHQIFNPGQHYTTSLNTLGFILRDIFNLMISATIATLIKLSFKWYRAERIRRDEVAARVEAELNTPRWQISPHFLLNTLNNIYALTAFDTPKAQESIQELSKMLRHILYDNQQPTVPVADEVEFMQNYIQLMRIRLPKSVEIGSPVRCPEPPTASGTHALYLAGRECLQTWGQPYPAQFHPFADDCGKRPDRLRHHQLQLPQGPAGP